ncbi:uncharacterized protein LOC133914353 [Phragmites australis]|uniref:uncharacterized protein LOC133914353 n=1 Tax=Phragmites australis TaxID=29695 RepID=UPI002D79D2B9|nr:uncharacterized protein LOC133914353 [Phragmites australis]
MPRSPAGERLTLEDYILFFTTRSGQGLSLGHLNQIIYMHAFAKLHRENKTTIVDALKSVDLMRPRRSTVSINATTPPPGAAPAAAAALSTEEATRDIEDIGWRECPVSSLLSVRAGLRAPAASSVPLSAIPPASPVPLAAIAPASAERVPPPSVISASSPLPLALPAPARRKRPATSKGKAAMRTRKRCVVELLTLPSVEMATSA